MATIRPLRTEDIPAALALWQGTSPVNSREVESIAGLASFLDRNPECSQVACEREAIIGVAICGHDGRRGYLHHLGVFSSHRRRGIGHRLVEACLAALHAEEMSRVHVQLKSDNADGLKFWKSLGCRGRKDTVLISLMMKSEGRDDS